MALKYSANLLTDTFLEVLVFIFPASFKSFQYSFAFLYFASTRRFVFTLSNCSLNFVTSALKSVLAYTIFILLVSDFSALNLFSISFFFLKSHSPL